PKYDTCVPESHFAHQGLEAVAVLGVRAGHAQVAVDRADALDRPTQGDCALAQRVLTLGALGLLEHLTQRGLPDIEERIALQMLCVDLVRTVSRHGAPPRGLAGPCWRARARERARQTLRVPLPAR